MNPAHGAALPFIRALGSDLLGRRTRERDLHCTADSRASLVLMLQPFCMGFPEAGGDVAQGTAGGNPTPWGEKYAGSTDYLGRRCGRWSGGGRRSPSPLG